MYKYLLLGLCACTLFLAGCGKRATTTLGAVLALRTSVTSYRVITPPSFESDDNPCTNYLQMQDGKYSKQRIDANILGQETQNYYDFINHTEVQYFPAMGKCMPFLSPDRVPMLLGMQADLVDTYPADTVLDQQQTVNGVLCWVVHPGEIAGSSPGSPTVWLDAQYGLVRKVANIAPKIDMINAVPAETFVVPASR